MIKEEAIIQKIEEICCDQGITKYELCAKADMNQSTLSSFMRKNRMPTITTLDRICKGFEITLSQFFAGMGESAVTGPYLDLTSDQMEIVDAWNRLNEDEKHYVRAFILSLSRDMDKAE
jgi:transcriptional regulator with XRE-family HTH domain